MEGGSRRSGASKQFQKPRPKKQGGVSSSAQQPVYRPELSAFHNLPPPQQNPYFVPQNPVIPMTQLLQSFDPSQMDSFAASVDPSFLNYRDSARDESSGEETQDLGYAEEEEEEEVQEVEEPRKKGKGKSQFVGRAKAQRWSDREEVALAEAWISVSEDPDQSNEQTRDGFWKKVTEHVAATLGHENRSLDQCYSKWRDLNHAMKKWNGFYQVRQNVMRASGADDEDVMSAAMADYKKSCKSRGFPHLSAWKVVRNSPNWAPIPGMGAETQQSKRSRSNEEGHHATSSDANFVPPDDTPPYEPQRPVRKSKSSSTKSSDTHAEILEQINKFTALNEADVDHKIKYREEKMRRQDLQFITSDHSHLTGPMLELVLQEKRDKAARWQWEFPY